MFDYLSSVNEKLYKQVDSIERNIKDGAFLDAIQQVQIFCEFLLKEINYYDFGVDYHNKHIYITTLINNNNFKSHLVKKYEADIEIIKQINDLGNNKKHYLSDNIILKQDFVIYMEEMQKIILKFYSFLTSKTAQKINIEKYVNDLISTRQKEVESFNENPLLKKKIEELQKENKELKLKSIPSQIDSSKIDKISLKKEREIPLIDLGTTNISSVSFVKEKKVITKDFSININVTENQNNIIVKDLIDRKMFNESREILENCKNKNGDYLYLKYLIDHKGSSIENIGVHNDFNTILKFLPNCSTKFSSEIIDSLFVVVKDNSNEYIISNVLKVLFSFNFDKKKYIFKELSNLLFQCLKKQGNVDEKSIILGFDCILETLENDKYFEFINKIISYSIESSKYSISRYYCNILGSFEEIKPNEENIISEILTCCECSKENIEQNLFKVDSHLIKKLFDYSKKSTSTQYIKLIFDSMCYAIDNDFNIDYHHEIVKLLKLVLEYDFENRQKHISKILERIEKNLIKNDICLFEYYKLFINQIDNVSFLKMESDLSILINSLTEIHDKEKVARYLLDIYEYSYIGNKTLFECSVFLEECSPSVYMFNPYMFIKEKFDNVLRCCDKQKGLLFVEKWVGYCINCLKNNFKCDIEKLTNVFDYIIGYLDKNTETLGSFLIDFSETLIEQGYYSRANKYLVFYCAFCGENCRIYWNLFLSENCISVDTLNENQKVDFFNDSLYLKALYLAKEQDETFYQYLVTFPGKYTSNLRKKKTNKFRKNTIFVALILALLSILPFVIERYVNQEENVYNLKHACENIEYLYEVNNIRYLIHQLPITNSYRHEVDEEYDNLIKIYKLYNNGSPAQKRAAFKRIYELKELGYDIFNYDNILKHYIKPSLLYGTEFKGTYTFEISTDYEHTITHEIPKPISNSTTYTTNYTLKSGEILFLLYDDNGKTYEWFKLSNFRASGNKLICSMYVYADYRTYIMEASK